LKVISDLDSGPCIEQKYQLVTVYKQSSRTNRLFCRWSCFRSRLSLGETAHIHHCHGNLQHHHLLTCLVKSSHMSIVFSSTCCLLCECSFLWCHRTGLDV